jgi:hypothetical protein
MITVNELAEIESRAANKHQEASLGFVGQSAYLEAVQRTDIQVCEDVFALVEEVRRLQEIVGRVEGIVTDKRKAADEYWERTEAGTIGRKYGYRRTSELAGEANYIERAMRGRL